MIAAASGIAAATLSVSPVRLRLTGAASRAITITNAGSSAASIDARPAGFVLDPRGKPVVARVRRSSAGWLHVLPQRFALAPGGKATVSVSAAAPAGALPGDHPALVLFTTQPPPRAGGVAIRIRVGVVVFVRVAGKIVHRLVVGTLRVRQHALEVVVVNRGNAVERAHVRVLLLRGGRVVARLDSAARTLLPHSRAIQRFRPPGRLRGWLTARVELRGIRRSLRIRL